MKSSFLISAPLVALVLIFTIGCNKNQLEDLTQEELVDNVFYRVSISDMTAEVEEISADNVASYLRQLQNEEAAVDFRSNNNNSASGLVNSGDGMTTFNAISNNGGVHGNTHVTDPVFWIDLKFDSECLLVLDNKAYWGGTVTTYVVGEPLQGLPFDVGWQFYWSAIDMGEGSQADPDEVGSHFIVIPPGLVATDYGFETWCDYTDYDYNLYDPSIPHYPHTYAPADEPTNIQID